MKARHRATANDISSRSGSYSSSLSSVRSNVNGKTNWQGCNRWLFCWKTTVSLVVMMGLTVPKLPLGKTFLTRETLQAQRRTSRSYQSLLVSAWTTAPTASFSSLASRRGSTTRRSRHLHLLQDRRYDFRDCSSSQALTQTQATLSRLFATLDTVSSSGSNSSGSSSSSSSSSSSFNTLDGDATTTSPSPSVVEPLKDITWIQSCMVQVLNDLYDAKQVALFKQQQLARKKNKNNNNNNNETSIDVMDATAAAAAAAAAAVTGDGDMSSSSSSSVLPTSFTALDAAVTVASRPEFGDYQCNAALTLAAALSLSPRECATQIVQAWNQARDTTTTNNRTTQDQHHKQPLMLLEPPEIAGPGFINLRYTKDYLCGAVASMAADAAGRCAVPSRHGTSDTDHSTMATANTTTTTTAVRPRQTIVVDYSSPNIAKEMHVGHLRSTILGDTLSNVLEFMGHKVVRLNHIGDWGTQFGMLVEHLRDEYPQALQLETAATVDLGDLVVLYKAAKQRFDVDDAFKLRARQGVVALQAGNSPELAAWEALCAASRQEYQKIYDTLNIQGLQERGESFYNPFLTSVVDDLTSLGLAVESAGATAVFLDGYSNRDGSPLPLLVRKSDGGFNYATTDLAAIRHRTTLSEGEHADRVLYVTDAGQSQHFEMVFAVARRAQFVPSTSSLEHVPFGLVQGADGKKFATRSGETVKLKDLLLEAVRIAGQDVRERNQPSTTNDEFQQRVDRVSRIVGIGAVKYADLSLNRESNYRFSYDRMLSLNGNTAPYMLYAYARICGIIRKATGQGDNDTIVWPEASSEIVISHETELDLIRNLVRLSDVIGEVERDLYPNRICDYLFETSQKFNKFYESCSVNQAETRALKSSRLSICTATAGTIRLLLTLLGIEVVEKL